MLACFLAGCTHLLPLEEPADAWNATWGQVPMDRPLLLDSIEERSKDSSISALGKKRGKPSSFNEVDQWNLCMGPFNQLLGPKPYAIGWMQNLID